MIFTFWTWSLVGCHLNRIPNAMQVKNQITCSIVLYVDKLNWYVITVSISMFSHLNIEKFSISHWTKFWRRRTVTYGFWRSSFSTWPKNVILIPMKVMQSPVTSSMCRWTKSSVWENLYWSQSSFQYISINWWPLIGKNEKPERCEFSISKIS